MTLTKNMAGLATGVASMSLVARSSKLLKHSLKKPSVKKTTKGFVDLTIGTAFLGPMSSMVNKL